MVLWSWSAFRASGLVRRIVVVGRREDLPTLAGLFSDPDTCVTEGGARRQDSVLCGLEALSGAEGRVLVHDVARPLVTQALIRRVSEAEGPVVVPVVPAYDTLKRQEGGRVLTLDRRGVGMAQTPQAFPLADLRSRLAKTVGEVTDEVQLYEAEGKVQSVAGDPGNLKITDPSQLEAAEAVLQRRAGLGIRIGHGYDIHPTVLGGGPMVLGGVPIPCGVRLVGHSDADVLLHAVADALLGGVGLPDIGHLFPPGRPETRGMASAVIVREAVKEVRSRGWRPWQIDATLALQSPRIEPYRKKIVCSLGELLGLPEDRVSVKATTEEGLDAVGQGLAAKAWAVVLLAQG